MPSILSDVGLEQGSDTDKSGIKVCWLETYLEVFNLKAWIKLYCSSLQINAYTISLLERRGFT
jgi:hypothetical protein